MAERKYQNIPPGSVINNWTFLEYKGFENGSDKYLVRCICGKECVRSARDIVTGRSKSCGCTRRIHPEEKKENRRAYKAKWFKQNKDRLHSKHVERQREQRLKDFEEFGTDRYRLKSLYGLSLDEYADMISLQGNSCAICGRPFVYEKRNTLRPCVDHNHETGVIRGVLCFNCNMALGLFQDSEDVLKKASEYVRGEGIYGKSIGDDKAS